MAVDPEQPHITREQILQEKYGEYWKEYGYPINDVRLVQATLEEILTEFDRRGLLYHLTFSAKSVVAEK